MTLTRREFLTNSLLTVGCAYAVDNAPAISTQLDGTPRTPRTVPRSSIRHGWQPPQTEPAARKRPSSSTPSPAPPLKPLFRQHPASAGMGRYECQCVLL